MFSPGEAYLVLGSFTDEPGRPATTPARTIYYRSLRRRRARRPDQRTTTCGAGTPTGSGARRAFGAQHPVVRRLWPARWRRSDVYHRLVRLEHRHQVAARIDRLAGPAGPRAGRAGRRDPAGAARPSSCAGSTGNVRDDAGVALPAAAARADGPGSARAWPLYPLRAGPDATSTSASGAPCRSWTVPPTATSTGPSSGRCRSWAGTSRSTPTRTTTGRPSTGSTAGTTWRAVKDRYDPDHRLTGLYEKAVARTMSLTDRGQGAASAPASPPAGSRRRSDRRRHRPRGHHAATCRSASPATTAARSARPTPGSP